MTKAVFHGEAFRLEPGSTGPVDLSTLFVVVGRVEIDGDEIILHFGEQYAYDVRVDRHGKHSSVSILAREPGGQLTLPGVL